MAFQLNNIAMPEIFGFRQNFTDLAAAGAVMDFGAAQSKFRITGYCKAGAAAVTATLQLSDTVGMGTPVTVGVLTLANGYSGVEECMANPAGKRYGRITVAGGTMDVRVEAAT